MTISDPITGILRGNRQEIPAHPPTPEPALRPYSPDAQEGNTSTGPGWEEIPHTVHDLSTSLPANVALLKVVRTKIDDRECFKLELYWRNHILATRNPEALRRQGRPGFSLADELDGQLSAKRAVDCLVQLRTWSETKYELTEWVSSLRREVGADLQLVIWDDTDFGIPWELFWHTMGEASEFLGTAIQVIRWTTIHDPARHDQFCAKPGHSTGGKVLYYEAPDMNEPNITIHHPDKHPDFKPASTMQDILVELAKPASYGLVYIRGHGTHKADLLKSRLAGVRLADLAGKQFPALSQSNSAVFLNACNSARAVNDERMGDASNRSFAEIFLRARAGSVIATMGEVPINHSAMLARRLVREARGDGVHIPELLRNHRIRYSKKLPDPTMDLSDGDQQKILFFIYASTFAYFGHPDSMLRLASS